MAFKSLFGVFTALLIFSDNSDNSTNGHLVRLTRTDPKRLHIILNIFIHFYLALTLVNPS